MGCWYEKALFDTILIGLNVLSRRATHLSCPSVATFPWGQPQVSGLGGLAGSSRGGPHVGHTPDGDSWGAGEAQARDGSAPRRLPVHRAQARRPPSHSQPPKEQNFGSTRPQDREKAARPASYANTSKNPTIAQLRALLAELTSLPSRLRESSRDFIYSREIYRQPSSWGCWEPGRPPESFPLSCPSSSPFSLPPLFPSVLLLLRGQQAPSPAAEREPGCKRVSRSRSGQGEGRGEPLLPRPGLRCGDGVGGRLPAALGLGACGGPRGAARGSRPPAPSSAARASGARRKGRGQRRL